MKRNFFLQWCGLLLFMWVCSVPAEAQDLKSILSGVAKAVIGDKATTARSIIGTWSYQAPECQFESDRLLAKAGGEVAAKEVEERLQTVYDKAGLTGIQYTFNEDGTYSYILKKRTVSGTYVFDDKAKTITMKGKLGIQTVAYVTVTGNSMSLVFNADKLMSILKMITGAASKVNSTAATLNEVAGAYDGLMLGFDLKK
ncbi:DUF4923 family protein [Phocaeicola sp.]|uniref:DUF4923 family protein n=1 Tax=Phocaeicola sp. TaxID=2773926 RepID=UPI0023CC2961|nr:DUF4923 family protein [Phocaeicola sp.]MDE5677108.1 DUF4923 family protein [Phocaeicola sp.]